MASSKNNNLNTFINDIYFFSQKKAERYKELLFLEKKGEIFDLAYKKKYTLQESFLHKDKKHSAIFYFVDFYYKKNNETYVEIIKKIANDLENIKKKIFLKIYGEKINFKEF